MEAQGRHVEETIFPLLCDVKVNALGLTWIITTSAPKNIYLIAGKVNASSQATNRVLNKENFRGITCMFFWFN